jgi:hypothetical protein
VAEAVFERSALRQINADCGAPRNLGGNHTNS